MKSLSLLLFVLGTEKRSIKMEKCSVENCENKCFENEDKCILHCEKDDKNNWHSYNNDNNKVWDSEKVELFWETIQEDLTEKCEFVLSGQTEVCPQYTLSDVKFPIFQAEQNNSNSYILKIHNSLIGDFNLAKQDTVSFDETKLSEELFDTLEIEFDNCKFLDIANFEKYLFKQDIVFSKCTFEDEIKLNKQQTSSISFLNCPEIKNLNLSKTVFEQKVEIKDCHKIGKLNLKDAIVNGKFIMNRVDLDYFNCSGSVFEKKVEIKECTFTKTSFYQNTKFKSLCDFYKTKFQCNNFERTTFEDIVVFTESEFHKDVNFKYTTFGKLALFRKTIFQKTVNFEDSIFKEEANFLDINANMANRETARIIKNSFEQQNNIIEANRFYALEMKEREKELELLKNPLEWIVFKLHGISSDHSQSWFLALFWILYFTFMFSFLSYFYNEEKTALSNTVFFIYFEISLIIGFFIDAIKDKARVISATVIIIVSYFVYGISSCDFALKCFSSNINPFSIMTSKEPITFGLLFFKITIAYLIYQFIVSVRQNTRRK